MTTDCLLNDLPINQSTHDSTGQQWHRQKQTSNPRRGRFRQLKLLQKLNEQQAKRKCGAICNGGYNSRRQHHNPTPATIWYFISRCCCRHCQHYLCKFDDLDGMVVVVVVVLLSLGSLVWCFLWWVDLILVICEVVCLGWVSSVLVRSWRGLFGSRG